MGGLIAGLIEIVKAMILLSNMQKSRDEVVRIFTDNLVGDAKLECPYKQSTVKAPTQPPKNETPKPEPLDSPPDFFSVPIGQLTFDVEGSEGGPYHSRKPHVPPVMSSGLTLGRGYDMGQRNTGSEIVNDLIAAGLTEEDANKFRGAAGLQREEAEKFLIDNKLENFEITPEQQNKLFNNTYEKYHKTTVQIIGQDDWEKLDPNIQTVLVDVVYKGEFKGKSYPPAEKTWRFMADGVNNNDLPSFLKGMKQLHVHQSTDENRIKHRLELIEKAIAKQAATKTAN